jgi:hypothetical protein
VSDRFEAITGLTVRDAKEAALQETEYARTAAVLEEVEDLAMGVMDYIHGQPHEVTHEKRRELSQRSRIALLRDPLAGAEAEMRSNFAFGRGIPVPQAQDPEVQRIIDRAWKDPVNRKKLTGFEAQRHRSNELLTQANLYPTIFVSNGRVRIAFINADLVSDIVCHSDDDELPLWYVWRHSKKAWDYDQDMMKAWTPEMEDGREKAVYNAHWRNVATVLDDEELGDEGPKKEKINVGLTEHFRINRVGRTQFGTPPWARVLRFFSAMNQFTEARVSMAQAAASIIATRTVKGGPKSVLKAASNVLAQTGEIAAARFGRGASPKPTGPGTNPAEGLAPPPTGSFWNQNEADQLTAMNLSSGASQAIYDRQLIAAPISAAAQFGQHWLGDPSATNMATATTLELPALMAVGAWQETFEEMFRWFTNRAIEAAIEAGELGGIISEGEEDERSLQDLVYEEDLEELETRTGKDLSYSFEMPYPGRRNLPDVINVVNAVATAYDPQGQNPWLRRKLLDFLFRHGLQTEDPARDVDDVMPLEDGAQAPDHPLPVEPDPEEGEGGEGEGGGKKVARDTRPDDEKPQRGEARRATRPTREMGGGAKEGVTLEAQEAADAELLRQTAADADREFEALLKDPAAFLAGRAPTPTPESNGASPATSLG